MGNCCKKKYDPLIQSFLIPEEELKNYRTKKHTVKDFELITCIGKGAFAEVILVKYLVNNKKYAMKVISKKKIKQTQEKKSIINEKNLLSRIQSPFILRMHLSFQDPNNLYIISDFMQGGDLFSHIKEGLSEKQIKLITAEIILALDFLHTNNIIYRDLKLENVLIDSEGHIKLADFGTALILEKSRYTKGIVGTYEYTAPEIHKELEYEFSIDYFALGCIIYTMYFKKVLLSHNINKLQCERRPATDEEYKRIPEIIEQSSTTKYISTETIDLLNQLLEFNPKDRISYGRGGCESIKNHPYFKGINWTDVNNKKEPIFPKIAENDMRYFKNTQRKIEDSDLSGEGEDQDSYMGFSFSESIDIQ